jgi:diguanylate cyclase (GGDEF)-like protein
MRSVQIVLNAILSKNIFEYILVDTNLLVIESSSGVNKYLGKQPKKGDDILEYIPEFVGNEDEIKNIFVKKFCLFTIETVYKNGYYINISIEYCDSKTAIVLLHNVTETTISQQSLLQYSNESTLIYNTLTKVINNQNSMVFVANTNNIEFANKQFLDYFNISSLDSIEQNNIDLYKLYDDSLQNYKDLYDALQNNENYIKINNDSFIIRTSMIEDTHILFTLTNINDISFKLNLDPLTGIYRKNYLNEIGEKILRNKEKFALVVLDLDDFKKINDTYGHQVGDKVLKEFVNIVKKQIRKDDVFARWGGEEFLLLMRSTTPNDVEHRVESIREHIEKYIFNEVKHITCSFGIACSKDGDDMDSILYRADKALYEAKASGKNKVIIKRA